MLNIATLRYKIASIIYYDPCFMQVVFYRDNKRSPKIKIGNVVKNNGNDMWEVINININAKYYTLGLKEYEENSNS